MPQQLPGVREPRTTPEQDDALASVTPSSRQTVGSVLVTGGPLGTLTDMVGREIGRRWDDAAEATGLRPRARTLTPEEATERYGIEGHLTFDRPISEREAAWRQAAKRDELFRQDILNRNDSVGGLEALGLSLTGALVDPVTIPLNFVPAFGQGALATRLGLGARAGSRLATIGRGAALGATEGAVIGGAVEGATFYLGGVREGRDYDLKDLMLGVTANALFGAGVRGALDGLGWRAPEVALGGPERAGVTRPGATRPARNLAAGDPVAAAIRQAAASAGEDADTAVAIAMIESTLNPNAKNPNSSASGVFQFLTGKDSAWVEMGGGDPFDADLNIRRGVQLMAQNRASLRRALGREPEPWELYLAHQQGAGGAGQLLKDPQRPAVDALRAAGVRRPADAVRLNGGDLSMTAGEFAGLWRSKFAKTAGEGGAADPAMQPRFESPPRVLTQLSEEQRLGAVAKALDDMAADRPVDVAPLIEMELTAGGRPRPALDEAADAPIGLKAQLLDDPKLPGEAVTPRGMELRVRYAIVEAADLITSHDDDLIRNPDFPEDLQPRDRERAGSQARLLRMEREFNPKLLMGDVAAAAGAPIVARDGVVDSGNGRTIMLRRNYRRAQDRPVELDPEGREVETRAAAITRRYREELERQGFDITGFSEPVLVRFREDALDGQTRVRLTREMNDETIERLSATEQAFADAAALSDDDLAVFAGGSITAVKNDAFARRFVDKAGAGQENVLVDGETQRLSQAGVERMQAALVARAFGDRQLIYNLFETQDPNIKTIGAGMLEAAPDWARMRGAIARGESGAIDNTDALIAAVALVRHVRDNRLDLRKLVEDWADQDRLLGGNALSPATRSYLNLFFQDGEAGTFKRPASAAFIGETLKNQAREALDTTPGPDLWGEVHVHDAATTLQRAAEKAQRDGFDPAAGSDAGDAGAREGGAAGQPGAGGGEGPEQPGGRRGGPGSTAGLDPVDAGTGPRDRPDGSDLEEAAAKAPADPEADELNADIAALEAELEGYAASGLFDDAELEAVMADPVDGDTWRTAIDAAAACLAEGGE